MAEPVPPPILWSPRAKRDLSGIHAYIAQFAPLAAQRFTARLVGTVESLTFNPHRGRSVGLGVRELAIVRPYLVRYRITAKGVEVLRIRHGARRPD